MHDRGQKGEENNMDRKLKKRLMAFTVPPYDEKHRKETLLLAEQMKEDMRLKDIACIMDIPVSTVRYRLKQTESKLRDKLA